MAARRRGAIIARVDCWGCGHWECVCVGHSVHRWRSADICIARHRGDWTEWQCSFVGHHSGHTALRMGGDRRVVGVASFPRGIIAPSGRGHALGAMVVCGQLRRSSNRGANLCAGHTTRYVLLQLGQLVGDYCGNNNDSALVRTSARATRHTSGANAMDAQRVRGVRLPAPRQRPALPRMRQTHSGVSRRISTGHGGAQFLGLPSAHQLRRPRIGGRHQ